MSQVTPAIPESPIHSPLPIVPYCAGCNREWPPDPQRRLGQRFVCPTNQRHLAALVKGDVGKLWLRVEARILRYELFSLALVPARFSPYKTPAMILARMTILAGALAVAPFGCLGRTVASLLSIAIIADVLLNATSVAFISRFPAHALRSVVIAIISFGLIAIAFGVLYTSSVDGFIRDGAKLTLSRLDGVYFSFVTVATLGYGDIHPHQESWVPKLLVICELLIGAYFLSILLATHAAWMSTPPNITEPPSYATLFPEQERGNSHREQVGVGTTVAVVESISAPNPGVQPPPASGRG